MRKLLFLLSAIAGCAAASDFSFTGSFTHDTDTQFFTFTLLEPTASVALRTWSYSGGTNALGQIISSGGFEPVLSLWTSDGTPLNSGISGPCSGDTGDPLTTLSADPVTGGCGDVYYPPPNRFPKERGCRALTRLPYPNF